MTEFIFVVCVLNLLATAFVIYRVLKIQLPPVVVEKEKEEKSNKPTKDEQWDAFLAYDGRRNAN